MRPTARSFRLCSTTPRVIVRFCNVCTMNIRFYLKSNKDREFASKKGMKEKQNRKGRQKIGNRKEFVCSYDEWNERWRDCRTEIRWEPFSKCNTRGSARQVRVSSLGRLKRIVTVLFSIDVIDRELSFIRRSYIYRDLELHA